MKPHLYIEPNLPDDDELQSLTDYVGGFMTEADEAAFDESLASDESFYNRMAPMLKLWHTRTPSVGMVQAGVRARQRRGAAERQVVRRYGWTKRATKLVAAAGLLIGMAQGGFVVLELVSRDAPAGPVFVKAPRKAPFGATAEGSNFLANHEQTPPAERPSVAQASPSTDSASPRILAEWASATVPEPVVTASSAPSIPTGVIALAPTPDVPIAKGSLETIKTDGKAAGPEIVVGDQAPGRSSGVLGWLRKHLLGKD